TADGNREGYMRTMPGLGVACVPWLHEHEVAAVATDTSAVEVIPFEDPDLPLPVHALCIRDMGLTLGEMFVLDALAEDCARDGVLLLRQHGRADAGRCRRHPALVSDRRRLVRRARAAAEGARQRLARARLHGRHSALDRAADDRRGAARGLGGAQPDRLVTAE